MEKSAYEAPEVNVIELEGGITADITFGSGWNTDGEHQGDVCTGKSGFCEWFWGGND